jgi:Cytochrome P450
MSARDATRICWHDSWRFRRRTQLRHLGKAISTHCYVHSTILQEYLLIVCRPSKACNTHIYGKSRAVTAWTFSNIIAGSDSTGVVMRTVWYNLLAHPSSLRRFHEELLEAERKNALTRPLPTWNEVRDLPYLDACINEAVRLHPPFCLPFERVVPEGGVTICGQYFARGTVVGISPYVVNRHRPTFGEDADVWRPERWLGHSEEHKRMLEQSMLTVSSWL